LTAAFAVAQLHHRLGRVAHQTGCGKGKIESLIALTTFIKAAKLWDKKYREREQFYLLSGHIYRYRCHLAKLLLRAFIGCAGHQTFGQHVKLIEDFVQ